MMEVIEQPKPPFFGPLQLVVLDWAGTAVDFGSRAPVLAIQAACEEIGVPVTETEAREPMGRAKRDHLAALLAIPAVSQRWREAHGTSPGEAEVDRLFATFLARQDEVLVEHSAVIEGCPSAVEACRNMGLKIGSSTGYSSEQLERVAARARGEGYEPDLMLAADDVSPGRPAPWLCIENARRLAADSMAAVVKVDDTPAGVAAGRNAGAWAIGVIESGNEVGLAADALEALPVDERTSRLEHARETLREAGAHLLINTIAELPEAIEYLQSQLARGATP